MPEDNQPTSPKVNAAFNRRVRKAVATRRIFPYLAGITLTLSIAAGILITIADREEFDNVGVGIWWAVTTLTTVGYGDFVPKNTEGRLVGAAIMLVGITFLSFLTATVTSLFVSADTQKAQDDVADRLAKLAHENAESLARIEQRLDAIDAQLKSKPE